ncbi:MAG: GNAT family N-acetyltransferase [Clostridia bacterium]|nr:GNAT family N-acetyltransferase [Clostridia bacterium]
MFYIREAEKSDYETIRTFSEFLGNMHAEKRNDIYKISSVYVLSSKEFKKILKSKNIFITVIEADGKVIGYCRWQLKICMNNEYLSDRSICFIDELYIAENFRQKGCGKHLYNAVVAKAKEMGATCVELYVWNFNNTASDFYAKLGLTPQRTLLEYKFE